MSNGVVVIVKEHHAMPLIALQVFIRTGSIYEGEYLGTGISHFVEHVIDDGTQHRTRQQIDTLVEGLGNDSNAYTWRDHTKYYITTTCEQFTDALDVLSDYIQHATFPSEEVEIQRGVILHELNKDEDEPQRRLQTLFYQTVYQVHPVRIPVGGYKEAFEKLTQADLIRFYQQTYIPDNAVVVAVGHFDADTMQKQLATVFEAWPRNSLPNYALPTEPPQIAPRRVRFEHDVELASLLLGFPTTDITHPDVYPLDIAALILAGGESARLPKLLCEQKQIAYSVDAWAESPSFCPGVLGIEATLEVDDLESVEHLILEQLERLCVEPVTDEELRYAKTLAESEYIFGLQTVEEQAATLGLNELAVASPEFSQIYIERLQNVTADDIQRVASTYFRPECRNTCILQPDRAGASATVAGSGWSPECKPCPDTIQKETLANGLRLLTCRNDSLPVVAVYATFLGGVRAEQMLAQAVSQNGVGYLTARLLPRGTTRHSAMEITAAVEATGGVLDTFSGHHSFGLSLNLLSKELPMGLDLLGDIVRHPAFPVHEVEWMQRQLLAQIRSEDDDWMTPAKKLFMQTLFQRYPYHLSPLGTEQSVSQIYPDDIRGFYERFCAPDNMVLAIYGDIEQEKVVDQVRSIFSNWESRSVPISAPAPDPEIREPGYAEKMRNMVQAVLFTGFKTVPCTSGEQYILHVLNAVLSGVGYPGGRLHNRLRQQQLVYMSYAYNCFGLDTGFFAICAVTTPEQLEKVNAVTDEELQRLRMESVPDEELDRAKHMCILNYQSDSQTIAERAVVGAMDELYGLGCDHSKEFASGVQQVTSEDVRRIANTYLTPMRQVTTVLRPK